MNAQFEDLIGKTLTKVAKKNLDTEIHFTTTDGAEYKMHHLQDCCESVEIESIVGELDDLVGSPILVAEESSDHNETDGGDERWTFYKIATVKGWVDIRWYGSSDGYYSTSVDFELVSK